MAKIIKELPFGEHTLSIETGEIARQASASVIVNVADTVLLVTIVARKEAEESRDFFPLTVNYMERSYAAGKIPGGFLKREGRPSEHETLVSRMIDRPIRPLFPKDFRNEVQIIAKVLSLNPEVAPDVLAMIGASAVLAISGLPCDGSLGACRVGYKDGIYLPNPSKSQLADSKLDLIVAGTEDAILMVESQAHELSEQVMLGAVLFGHEMMQPVIKGIKELAQEVGNLPWQYETPVVDEGLQNQIQEIASAGIESAYNIREKSARSEQLSELRRQVTEQLTASNEALSANDISNILARIEKKIVRNRVLTGEPRIDGRDNKAVRPIAIRTGILPRAHGSALFTRGETQALVTTTLGNERDAQIIDAIAGDRRERFMLHYNFPPYCVGETGMMLSPKRREIGHGNLARRSIEVVLPEGEECPYVLRVVSEITESNGSSSMASVCGTSLALMDAGIPIKSAVAGIAMGLVKEGDQYVVLTDILGDEDHLGDMDFKVAGTVNGVTALQMDIKVAGITREILEAALAQALEARKHILNQMQAALSGPRANMSEHAPRITTIKIHPDKIRDVIGKGGATVRALTEETGVTIDINDDGIIKLFSPDQESAENAIQKIKQITADVEVGGVYQGTVTKIVEYGAFVNILPGKDGLLHISQISTQRIEKVTDELQEGQVVEVKVLDIDRQKRVKLSMIDVNAQQ